MEFVVIVNISETGYVNQYFNLHPNHAVLTYKGLATRMAEDYPDRFQLLDEGVSVFLKEEGVLKVDDPVQDFLESTKYEEAVEKTKSTKDETKKENNPTKKPGRKKKTEE